MKNSTMTACEPATDARKTGRQMTDDNCVPCEFVTGIASTVHKSQGLSLDRVQVDCRARFFGSPAMAYVSVSRTRTPEGLRIVGTLELFAKQVKVAPEVLRWL